MSAQCFIVTSYAMDGAASAALLLRMDPEADVLVTSSSRISQTLFDIEARMRRGGVVHVCGLGLADRTREVLVALENIGARGGVVHWYCGRGYLDEYAPILQDVCMPHLRTAKSNAAALAQTFDDPLDQADHELITLANQFVGRQADISEDHQFWHDLVDASTSLFFKYGDEDAYPACIRKLAGVEEVDSLDEREVEAYRNSIVRSFPLGRSPAMKSLRKMITRLAPLKEPVLVCGPSGSGKELIAKLLHDASDRRVGPFVPVNCAILSTSADMAHDRLFGHVEGAYTGARKAQPGAFVSADDGTLFLDEVAELPLAVQTQLLRVLEEGAVLPAGTMEPVPVNVRIVAATNRDLLEMVDAGTFRNDLYYRLNVLALPVPSLAERVEDMRSIAKSVLHELKESNYPLRLRERDWRVIEAYSWPGNIRQFRNILKRAAYLQISVEEALGAELRNVLPLAGAAVMDDEQRAQLAFFCPQTLTAARPESEVRCAYMRHVLGLCDGNWTQAARKLNIAVNTLRKWLEDEADSQSASSL